MAIQTAARPACLCWQQQIPPETWPASHKEVRVVTTERPVPPGSSVLIVDPSADCREVLSTLLRRRGVQTWEADEASQALDVLREHRPDVVVVDLDSDAGEDIRRQRGSGEDSAYIFLGRVCPSERDASGHVISKPYHYAPLIRTIERLLRR